MSYYNGKYSVGIDSKGYIIAERGGKRYYQKKRAPTFVNKFGGGDSSYRDASFWQYFVQTNWRNGAKQMKFDDPGKFWKSSNVDVTQLEQIKLSKALVSAGQLAANVKVNVIESWRASGTSPFGSGSDSTYTVSADATDAPVDSACTGTSGTTSLSATNAGFAANQMVLIHQTKGTNAGKWEKRTIQAYTAGTITLTEPLTYTYSSGAQVLVLKQYTTVTIDSGKTLTGKSWNGTVGGIVGWVASVSTTITGSIVVKGTDGSYQTANSGNADTTGGGFYGGRGGGNQPYSGWGNNADGAQDVFDTGGNGGGGHQDHAGRGGGNLTAGSDSGDNKGGDAVGNAALTNMFFGGGGGGGSYGSNSGSGGSGGGIVFLFSKAITVTGAINVNGGAGGSGSTGRGGGGGAGGSVLLKCQTAVLGSGLITASGGAGGAGGVQAGGAGGNGGVHVDYATSVSGTTTPTLDSSTDSTLADTQASTSSTAYAGASNGKIYSWDNATTWTEVFDTRQLTQFDTGTDTGFFVGDDGGTEKACAQGFQVTTAGQMKGVRVYLKKNAGTPGDITVRIETNSSTVPSGTLVDAAATGTITAFTTATDAWYTVEFSSAFALAATTTYWIVLKTAAAGNDNNYKWEGKTASGYSGGTNATSTDGGSTWSAGTSDAYFRVLGNTTSVESSLITKVSTTKKMYFGTGNPSGVVNGDARIYSFDGTTWALVKTFTTTTESVVNSMTEYGVNSKVYIGVGPQARIYETSDMSTITVVSKDIDIPDNPGYVYAIKEYNSYLYAGGGSPELVPSQKYDGFLNYYDQTTWRQLYPFDFTVLQSMEFYDAYLFTGTYHGQLYVYDTSSLNPLFSFKDQYEWQQTIYRMKYFDDKLYIGLYPQESSSDTNAGVWVFERHGLYNANTISGVTGYRSFAVVNGVLLVGTGDNGYVYKLSTTQYETQGYYQSSYFDANLPSIDKLYKEVTIKHDALATGESVVVYYRFKEDDSWTTLGTSSTLASTEKTLAFATAVYSKKITLKVELNGSGTTSPKVTEVIMKYTLYPERKWLWTMRLRAKKALQLFDRSTEARSATQIRADLEDLMDTQSLYAFTDVDGTTYTVLVNDIDQSSWVVNSDDVNEDEVVLTLIEA